MTNALTSLDCATLAAYGKMVADEDRPPIHIPVLKIQYDTEAKTERGVWVVGQKKDEAGNIIDEGKVVKALVILTTRKRFSFYNQSDTSKNCQSPMYSGYDQVIGNKLGCVCGDGCPNRAKEAKPRCRRQVVVYGVAIATDNQKIDCQAYISGESFFSFVNYMKEIGRVKTAGGMIDLPPFHAITMLGTEKKSGGTRWAGTFKKGPMLSIDQATAFAEKREEVTRYIDCMRGASLRTTASSAPVAAARHDSVVAGTKELDLVEEGEIPVDIGAKDTPGEAKPAMEATTAPVSGAGDDELHTKAATRMATGTKAAR